jgi:nucleolar protein 56
MPPEKNLVDKIHIIPTIIGILGLTDDNMIVEKSLYDKDPKKIVTVLEKITKGETTRELEEIIGKLSQRGFSLFVFTNSTLANTIRKLHGVAVEVANKSTADDFIRSNLEHLAIEYGLVKNNQEFYELNREISVFKARRAIQEVQSKRGTTIPNAVQLLNEIDKTLNILSTKLREWYNIHFPELAHVIDRPQLYSEIVKTFGDRDNIQENELILLNTGSKDKIILKAAQESMGVPLHPDDSHQLITLATHIGNIYGYRQGLEKHISTMVAEIAPNLSEVAGPLLAARLIEKGGGLRKLAMQPSSTIQLLGAEKALFRSKKTGSKPPKHGLIFQHPFVHSQPRKLRGRYARALSSKLALAARADAFTGNRIGEELRRQLDNYARA